MEFGGTTDQESMEMYLKKLQSLSEYHIDNTQKYYVTGFYLQNKNRHPKVKHRHKIRAEFNSQKHKLKQEWSTHYSLKWPTEHYKITVNNKPETTIAFQVHHIVPINSGGVNYWWNISPLDDENHKKLHSSVEEHACFSHDIVEQKICRFALKIKEIFHELTTKIIGSGDQTKPAKFAKSCSAV